MQNEVVYVDKNDPFLNYLSQLEHKKRHEICIICYSVPEYFGLLENCSHLFCFTCIKKWRSNGRKINLNCPLCRKPSKTIIKNLNILTLPYKQKIIAKYKAYRKNILCKNLNKCRFGIGCWYKH